MPVSQRASVRDGVSGREKGVRMRVRLLIPHSSIGSRSLHRENMGEEGNNEGREEMDTLNTELHWQGAYQPDTPTAMLNHRPSINEACVWYVGTWKTVLVMLVQLRNISALLGYVMIHSWACQWRRENQELDKVRDEEAKVVELYRMKREWGEQIDGNRKAPITASFFAEVMSYCEQLCTLMHHFGICQHFRHRKEPCAQQGICAVSEIKFSTRLWRADFLCLPIK